MYVFELVYQRLASRMAPARNSTKLSIPYTRDGLRPVAAINKITVKLQLKLKPETTLITVAPKLE